MKLTLIDRARGFLDRTAIIDGGGRYTYARLLKASEAVAVALLGGEGDLVEKRVAFLTPPGFEYVAVQWGVWRAGGVAVPLAPSHPRPELEYIISDSEAAMLVAAPEYEAVLRSIAHDKRLPFLSTAPVLDAVHPLAPEPAGSPPEPERMPAPDLTADAAAVARLPAVDPGRRAMMLYTSGTTGRPKGVVFTHRTIDAQVTALVDAWAWSPDDHILHVLPLHHIHGIINALTCALWSGATCEMLPGFSPQVVWQRFRAGGPTLFMAVPTIYARLISAWEQAPTERQRALTKACSSLRLMVSGSAALPVSVLERWRQITGHVLLERYGMTETGMVLSNPLMGERIPGYVGDPLPGVEVRLVDDEGNDVSDGTPGEILVRGPSVFMEYWRQPAATSEAFVNGWFRTGDVAVREAPEKGNGGASAGPDRGLAAYRILGRKSTDIIKTGGYKVSALEIESALLEHPVIRECAVVGIEDEEWGERVSAAVVCQDGADLTLETLRGWAKARMAPYKAPTRLVCVDDLPRNAMGKVVKPEVAKLFLS